jgi:hypothetical protein
VIELISRRPPLLVQRFGGDGGVPVAARKQPPLPLLMTPIMSPNQAQELLLL